MVKNGMRPIYPGEILREEYMAPLGLSANALARALGVTPARVNDIVRERRGVTADTALRLARYFGTDAESWINLQAAYDLRETFPFRCNSSIGLIDTKRTKRAWMGSDFAIFTQPCQINCYTYKSLTSQIFRNKHY